MYSYENKDALVFADSTTDLTDFNSSIAAVNNEFPKTPMSKKDAKAVQTDTLTGR